MIWLPPVASADWASAAATSVPAVIAGPDGLARHVETGSQDEPVEDDAVRQNCPVLPLRCLGPLADWHPFETHATLPPPEPLP